MSEPTSFLAPGPLPLLGKDVHILSALGRVGDGLVYLARDSLRQARLREYAPLRVVRRLPDGTLQPADPRLETAWRDAAQRFVEQGHRLGSIDHHGLAPIWRAVSVQAVGARHGAYTIGSPVGEPLSAALASGLTIPPAEVMRIAHQLADVLADIHARGITHLDISPDTVSIAGGHVQLTDFAIDNRPFMALLESQEGLVRPGYSPIEHHDASMAEPLGPAADIYAASALLFRLVAGRDPAPWQDRWRDPAASPIADNADYPAAFVEAIRRGMAIEPDDRFSDGAEWREALGLDGARPVQETDAAEPVRVVPAAPPAEPEPTRPLPAAAEPDTLAQHPPARRRGSITPLLLLLALAAIALAGYFAYQQRWFFPEEDGAETVEATTTRKAPAGSNERSGGDDELPQIEPGSTVSGQLTSTDSRRGGGQSQDRFRLRGEEGDRIDLRLSSADFDPLLLVSGPGLDAENDDDAGRGTRDSRLVLTLPRTGTYTVAVTSYRRGGTGNYVLEAKRAGPVISVASPAALAGRWRLAEDEFCENPLMIVLEGRNLLLIQDGEEVRQRLMDGVGRTIRTESEEGQQNGYRLSDDGDAFDLEGESWVRC